MKSAITLVITIFTLGLLGQSKAQKILTLEYAHGLNLDSIEVPGKFLNIKQLCTKKIDSVITTGNVGFKHSNIGKIRDCFYQYQIRQDTIRIIVIKTNKAKVTGQVISQTNLQFGAPIQSIVSEDITYKWTKVFKNKIIVASMTTTQSLETSVLTIKEE